MYGFVYQVSFIISILKSGLFYWSSYGNYDGKGFFDLGESRDLDMILRLNRKSSNCSEEGNNRDSDVRFGDIILFYKERIKDIKVERIKISNSFFENLDVRFENLMQLNLSSESNSLCS